MAKTRSGLGRGLESLLGGSFDNAFTAKEENETTKEENVARPKAPVKPEVKIEVKEEQNLPSSQGQDQNQAEAQTQPQNQLREENEPQAPVERDLYVNKEDKLTIKSVVEREPKDGPDFEVDIMRIVPNPDQPRTNFKPEELSELAESIKRNGLLQPLLVRRVGEKYQIIAGERRWQACKNLGMKKVPVRIREADEDESIILALIENIQRSDLNPIEEAYGYRRMMERGKMTQSEVAQAVSKGRTTITNALRLLELPEEAQQLLFEEKITAGHARAILSIPSQDGRRKLTEKLVEEKLSVREAETLAKQISGKEKHIAAPARPRAPKSFKTVARALSENLDTEVKVKSVSGKNKIEIAFKDEEDLERLFRIITK